MKMNTKANLTLLLVLLLFFVSVFLTHRFPDQWWPKLLEFMAEAGLVGGLADLFAVTALFKRPMGLPFPHTAIIPNNREKLIDSVVNMVESELLSQKVIEDKLARLHIVNALVQWIEKKGNSAAFIDLGWKWVTGLLSQLDMAEIARTADRQIIRILKETDLSPYAGKLLSWALDSGKVDKVLDSLIEEVYQYVSRPGMKDTIRRVLESEKENVVNTGNFLSRLIKKYVSAGAEKTNVLNMDEAAAAFYNDLSAFVQELRWNRSHPLRVLVKDRLRDLAVNLDGRSDLSRSLDDWKQNVLRHVSFTHPLESLLATLMDFLQTDTDLKYVTVNHVPLRGNDIREWGKQALQRYWVEFRNSPARKDWLEEKVQGFLRIVIRSEHRLIGQIVRDTLNTFTNDRLVSFVKDKVGDDLQRIRINGSLVGGVIGGLLFLLLHIVYVPFLKI